MCGRFTYRFTWKELYTLLNIHNEETYTPLPIRYNVAPTQTAPVVREENGVRTASLLTWGLRPAWMQSKLAPINARCETVSTSPMFRSAVKARRCVVPVSGFYEWQKLGEGPKPAKQPWHIHRADGAILLFAGLWEPPPKSEPNALSTFTIVTTSANQFVSQMHDRMPVVLEPEAVEGWLGPTPQLSLLRPAADGVLTAEKISTRVNSPKNDDATVLQASA